MAVTRRRKFFILLSAACIVLAIGWVVLSMAIGPFDRLLQGTSLERITGWLRFRQFVTAPVPDGVYDIRGGCAGTLIDIESRLSFRLKDPGVGDDLVKGWKLETRPEYLWSPCPTCLQYWRPTGDGALVLDHETLLGKFFKNGC